MYRTKSSERLETSAGYQCLCLLVAGLVWAALLISLTAENATDSTLIIINCFPYPNCNCIRDHSKQRVVVLKMDILKIPLYFSNLFIFYNVGLLFEWEFQECIFLHSLPFISLTNLIWKKPHTDYTHPSTHTHSTLPFVAFIKLATKAWKYLFLICFESTVKKYE